MKTTVEIQGQGLAEDVVRVSAPGRPELADEYFVDEGRPRRIVVHSQGGGVDVFRWNREGSAWLVVHELISGELESVMVHADVGVRIEGDIIDIECWDHWPPKDDEVHGALEDHLDHLRGASLMSAYRAARTSAIEGARASAGER